MSSGKSLHLHVFTSGPHVVSELAASIFVRILKFTVLPAPPAEVDTRYSNRAGAVIDQWAKTSECLKRI
jgi:hypothetical protein